jgi:hypothetical protein
LDSVWLRADVFIFMMVKTLGLIEILGISALTIRFKFITIGYLASRS